jgi:hypothetical protein
MDFGFQKMNRLDLREELRLKIIKLSQNIWEERVKDQHVKSWLENFTDSDQIDICESTHALYLLSNFMYFGVREIRELLKSVFRDKVKNPLVQNIRRGLGNTKNIIEVSKVADSTLKCITPKQL